MKNVSTELLCTADLLISVGGILPDEVLFKSERDQTREVIASSRHSVADTLEH
ncbi:hypothetical protein NJ7G_3468 [Natrinema sp. J7-2]|nr:hypothetical protein NJ7G_3468 [Natrinema sp. J7-2]